jgi:hypothetical protein
MKNALELPKCSKSLQFPMIAWQIARYAVGEGREKKEQ